MVPPTCGAVMSHERVPRERPLRESPLGPAVAAPCGRSLTIRQGTSISPREASSVEGWRFDPGSSPGSLPEFAVLASGNGTNLQAVLDACAAGAAWPPSVAAVISDHADAFAFVPRHQGRSVPSVENTSAATLVSNATSTTPAWPRAWSPGSRRLRGAGGLDADPHQQFPRLVPRPRPRSPSRRSLASCPGTHAIDHAWHEALAGERTRTGVMVHRVPDEGVDDGPVGRLSEGADRRLDDTLDTLTTRPRRRTRACWSTPCDGCATRSQRCPRHGVTASDTIQTRRHTNTRTHDTRTPDTRHEHTTRSETPMTTPNETLFDRYDALTFDDVVDRAGLLEKRLRRGRHVGHVCGRHRARRTARVGGDGQGHRSPDGDRAWPATGRSE